jgi:predicted nucleic acid-binding protein
MKPTFVDTSFLLGLVLADDELHEAALRWRRAIGGPLLTTEYVLVEFADALSHEHLRGVALSTIALLRGDPDVRIIAASSGLLDRALELFGERMDKQWALTDCISFVVMEDEEATDALTADHHFEQASFVALLRRPAP